MYKSVYKLNRYKRLFTIYKRSNGVYYFSVYKGEKRVRFSTGKKTKAEALNVAIKEYAKVDNIVVNLKTVLFKDYVKDFFSKGSNYQQAILLHGKSITHGYWKKQEQILNLYILPYFKNMDIKQIKNSDIENWLLSLNLSSKTEKNILQVLKTILKFAYREKVILYNIANDIIPITSHKTYERGCFTDEEIKLLFSKEWNNNKVKTICMLSAFTGMRLGECIALSKKDLGNNSIRVSRSYSYTDGTKNTKSGKVRYVALSSQLKALLLDQVISEDFIFCSGEYEMLSLSKKIGRELSRHLEIIKDYKERHLSFHSFRHYFNTRLVASGISGEIVRAVIGHESKDMTDNYLHLSDADYKSVSELQNKLMKDLIV